MLNAEAILSAIRAGLEDFSFPVETDQPDQPEPSSPAPTSPVSSGTWAREIPASLREAAWVVVDVETTALTPASEPLKPNRGTPKGADLTPRLRVVTALWPEKGGLRLEAWDMDILPFPVRGDLRRTILARPTVVGHNVGFDLYWLRHGLPGAPMPPEIIDTMLLARYARPGIPAKLAVQAVKRDISPALKEAAAEKVKNREKWSLAAVCLALFHTALEKGFQKPENWTPPAPLSPEHYCYATSDVLWTYRVWQKLCGEDWPGWKEKNPTWTALIAGQVADVVAIRETGIPIDQGAVREYRQKQLQEAEKLAHEAVSLAPELAPFREAIVSEEAGETATYKQAFAAALRRMGVESPVTETGAISTAEPALRLAGLFDHPEAGPFLKALTGAKAAVKRAVMAREYAGFAARSHDGKIHPFLSHGTSTGRLSSAEPNAQNLPRDPEFRALVRVTDTHRIISADYSGIELRIAAALAVRAQREAAERPWALRMKEDPAYRVSPEAVAEAQARYEALAREKARDWDALRHAEAHAMKQEAMWLYGRLLDLSGGAEYSAMREIFRRGGDIHLYTGLALLGRDPADALDPEKAAALKADPAVKAARQNAKPANFGLLYGMQARTFRQYAKVNYRC